MPAPKMSDLIGRLEAAAQWDGSPSWLIHEAIARITDLEAENARLRDRLAEALKALEPFASVALLDQTPDAPRGMWVSVPFGWLQDARRVREGGKSDA